MRRDLRARARDRDDDACRDRSSGARAGPRRDRARRSRRGVSCLSRRLCGRPRRRPPARPSRGAGAAAGAASARRPERGAARAPGARPHGGVARASGSPSRGTAGAAAEGDGRGGAASRARRRPALRGEQGGASRRARRRRPADRRRPRAPRGSRRLSRGSRSTGLEPEADRVAAIVEARGQKPANGALPGGEGVLGGGPRAARCRSGRRRVRIGELHPTFHLHRAHSRKPATTP